METFQILSDQFSHFQHLFHRWLAIFCIISSYIFDLSSSPHTWGIRGRILSIVFLPVHPHLCWAYPSLHLAAISQNGSSPHTWGIPSCPQWSSPCSAVHPHIRGAYMGRPAKIYVKNGSSPHTWGIRLGVGGLHANFAVHPHIRGAYDIIHQGMKWGFGSSPHTWGILDVGQDGDFCIRFIPTYVGHTLDRRKKNGWFQPLLL